MIDAPETQLDRLRADLNRPVIQLGLVAIAVIVLVQLWLVSGEAVTARRATLAEAETRRAEQALAVSGVDWTERRQAARERLDVLQAALWKGSSAGIVRARAQSWLQAAAVGSLGREAQIRFQESEAEIGDRRAFIADVVARTNEKAVWAFLQSVETNTPHISVREIDVRTTSTGLTLTATLVFPYEVTDGPVATERFR